MSWLSCNIHELSHLNPIFSDCFKWKPWFHPAFNMFKTGSEARCTDASGGWGGSCGWCGWWLLIPTKPFSAVLNISFRILNMEVLVHIWPEIWMSNSQWPSNLRVNFEIPRYSHHMSTKSILILEESRGSSATKRCIRHGNGSSHENFHILLGIYTHLNSIPTLMQAWTHIGMCSTESSPVTFGM